MESVDFTWNCLDREIQDEKQEEERESKEVERAYDKKMSISVRFSLMWQGCPIHNQSSNDTPPSASSEPCTTQPLTEQKCRAALAFPKLRILTFDLSSTRCGGICSDKGQCQLLWMSKGTSGSREQQADFKAPRGHTEVEPARRSRQPF